MKNRFIKRAHISEQKFKLILRYFTLDYDATKTSQLTNISRKTINKLYHKIRKAIFNIETQEGKQKLKGEIEIDESYFGSKRIRGKKGRGAKGKIPVIGILKRNDKVYTQIVVNCRKKELLPIIKGQVLEKSTIYTDGWRSYQGLVLNGYKHYRIFHHENEFARGKNHINGIESFLSFTKRRLRKFNVIKKDMFLLHLKESQFRWNKRKTDIYKFLLKYFRENPL